MSSTTRGTNQDGPNTACSSVRTGRCVLASIVLTLTLGLHAVSADPPPPRGVNRAQARALDADQRTHASHAMRNQLTLEPPRTPDRRVFNALRLEPWLRGGRVGVRMSASF
jgi:hypothetical protein